MREKCATSGRLMRPKRRRKLVAKLTDLSRFRNLRQLMGYLGLVPTQRSTEGTVNRRGITKTGNGRAQRVPSSLELSPSFARFA